VILAILAIATASFSIVARDVATGDVGVAVASHAPAAGPAVLWTRAGAGALAVQAYTDPAMGTRGLELLAQGSAPRAVLEQLLEGDPRADRRQIAVIDMRGACVTHTGRDIPAHAGAVESGSFCVQGNFLTGAGVLEAMASAYRSAEAAGLGLGARLLAALEAGDAAGGDRPGLRSAALRVATTDPARGRDRSSDLRVDDDEAPVRALRALHDRVAGALGHRELWQAAGDDVRELQRLLRRAGLSDAEPTGVLDDATVAAVVAFRRAQGLHAGESRGRLGLVDADLIVRLRAAPEKKR
jgi:uncharacterized Ntn-hydrolase superfamily protein